MMLSSLLGEKYMSYMPLFLVFMSGFGFSVQGLVIKLLEEKGYHASFQLLFIRGCIQVSISSCFVYRAMLNGEKTKLFGDSKYASFILLLRALFGFGGMSFGFLAIEHLPIGDASTLVMQSPILSAILGYFILNEPWRLAEFAATIISMIGVTLISRPSFIFSQFQQKATEQSVDKLGVLFAVLAALCAGCAFITVRMLGTSAKMPWQNVVFSAALGQCILSTSCMFLSGQKFTLYLSHEKWLLLICGSLVGTFSQFAMTIGMQKEKSASATAMRTSDVIFAFIWQIMFTSDKVTWLSIIGATLVMIGILIIVFFKSQSIPVSDAGNNSISSGHTDTTKSISSSSLLQSSLSKIKHMYLGNSNSNCDTSSKEKEIALSPMAVVDLDVNISNESSSNRTGDSVRYEALNSSDVLEDNDV